MFMEEDDQSDEQLAQEYLSGKEEAFDELFSRYFGQIRYYLLTRSWYHKDDNYIDELVYAVFRVLWECLEAKGFKNEGPGSFRRLLCTIARLECYKHDTEHAKNPMTTSAMFPSSFADIPIGTIDEPVNDEPEKESTMDKLNKTLVKLTPDEQKLMRLVANQVKYKDILKEPEFCKYSLDYLKLKIYNIRNKLKKVAP